MGLNKKLCIKRSSADCNIFLYSNFIPVVNRMQRAKRAQFERSPWPSFSGTQRSELY